MNDPSGIAALQAAISGAPAGERVIVFGYSEGATVVGKWLAQHADDPDIPSPELLTFVVVGNPSRQSNGITIPNGVEFPQSQYQVLDLARQYDGVADFPNNPKSPYYFLAVRNATRGSLIGHLHNYSNVDIYDPANAVWTSEDGNTTYVLVPTQNVPLLGGLANLFPDWNAELKAKIETAYIRPTPFPTSLDPASSDAQVSAPPLAPENPATSVTLPRPGPISPTPVTLAVTTSSAHQNAAEPAETVSETASTGTGSTSEAAPSGATETEPLASTFDGSEAVSPSGGAQNPSGTKSSSTSGQPRRPLLNRLRTSLGLKPSGDQARAGRNATGSASDRGSSHSGDE